MALLPGGCILSEPSLTRAALTFAAASCILALGGCDTENGTASQGTAPDTAAAAPAGETEARYRIDRSHAGDAMAEAVVRDPAGQARALFSLRGRPVVLNLWATWCAPCVEELPTLDRLAARLGDDAHVIVLSQDLGEADVPAAFLAERGWRRVQGWHDPENAAGLEAGGSLPTTILYDQEAREVLRVVGPLDWSGPIAAGLLVEAGIGE
jgi:thiol-disulfide isomerase/thioredoxin